MTPYQITNTFTHHPPKPGQTERYEALREKARELAFLIVELCPSSRDRTVAITRLQETVMFANASIAINE